MKKNIIYDMVEMAMLVSLAIVLDKFVKIPLAAGSINISMFPLFLIALRHGPIKGFMAGGIVYGLICCLTDGYGFQTYPLEYLLAYGSVGLVGLFSKKIFSSFKEGKYFLSLSLLISSMLICILIRLTGACIDSILFYECNLEAALVYNIPYVVPSGMFVIVIITLLLHLIIKLNQRYKTSYLND